MSDSRNSREFASGARVVLNDRDTVKNGQACTVIRVLPNPSGRVENQWYDVRFDDNSLGRFAGRYLAPVNAQQSQREIASPAA